MQNVPNVREIKEDLNEMTSINEIQTYLLSDFLDYMSLENNEFELLNKEIIIEQIFIEVK
jgi:hypothetical protein